MLSVKKVLAGRGATDYYLNQTRRGLADYYLPEGPDERADEGSGGRRLQAPGSSWSGGGADELGLSGEVDRATFVPLFAKGVRPGGGYLGRRFRQPEEAAAAKAEALRKAGEIPDPYDRWMARHRLRRKGRQASVAAWDCTFSPVKSVSLLWAAGDAEVQREVWAAHAVAVDAGLAYLQEHAAYVRAGKNGVRVLDTHGLLVARMNEWTSRSGDMQIHTHCLVFNRARTVEDGKWRALDGRALLSARTGAGAIYNRTLETELTRRLGVAWRDRPDGLRELQGVDDDLIEAFSTRRRAITSRVADMAAAYRDRYGFDPPDAVMSSMAQDATLATRPSKRTLTGTEALDRWEAQARERGRALDALPRRVLNRQGSTASAGGSGAVDDVGEVVARLAASGRSTFSRHDLLRAALDVLPAAAATTPAALRSQADALVEDVLTSGALLRVTADDPVDVPDVLRRRDDTSVYDQPERHRWALMTTLDQERWLLNIATEPTGRPADRKALEDAAAAHGLGDDQAAAVHELLGADRRIGLLIGPAGAGKTRTLRAAVDAWQRDGGHVLGLTVSQAAAQVLSEEAQVRAENTAKWLYETRRGQWTLPDRPLVLIDEASMVATNDLVAIIEQARHAGGRVLLVGDPAQLAAIHVGGAFDLLADRHGAARLHEIRRFTHDWEAHASTLLRRRDPTCLAEYAMRARIHGGTQADIEARLFDAWKADALPHDRAGQRRSVLMIVATNEQAALLAEKARHQLLAAGVIDDGPTVRLRDNVASVGDHIVTRRNDRRLTTGEGGWVVNGDVWTITTVHRNGAVDARRHRDNATIRLPADYLTEHTHLAYATTAHRAQGMTVDRSHAAILPDSSHQHLYVATTRGRDANHLWVAMDADRDLVRDPDDLPAPEQTLATILQRRDLDRLSAHQISDDSHHATESLARLGQIFEDTARHTTDQWLRQHLERHGLPDVADDPEWHALVDRCRQIALAGHDQTDLLDRAIQWRPIDDAHSPAAVLQWRLGQLDNTIIPRRRPGPLASLPPADGPHADLARQVGELMRLRWRQIRHKLSETIDLPDWIGELGPRPDDLAASLAWLTATTAVAAYRERFDVPDYQPLLGHRPGDSRPDAQAAYDHALDQVDRYLARPYRHLTDDERIELHRKAQTIIDRRPPFDPSRLERAHHQLQRPTHDSHREHPLRRQAARQAWTEETRKTEYDNWAAEVEAAASVQERLAIAARAARGRRACRGS